MEFILKKTGIYEIFSSLLLGIIVIITGYYLELIFIFDNLFTLINIIDNDFIELSLFLSFCYILGTFISELENILEKICIMFDFRSQATKNFVSGL